MTEDLAVQVPEKAAEDGGNQDADEERPMQDALPLSAVGAGHPGQQIVQPVLFSSGTEEAHALKSDFARGDGGVSIRLRQRLEFDPAKEDLGSLALE